MDRMCPDTSNSLVCQPGARIGKVKAMLTKLQTTSNVEHLVLVAGTNHIPSEKPATVRGKMKGLIHFAQDLFPSTKIYLSSILPKIDCGITPAISELNDSLRRTCKRLGVDFIYNQQFFPSDDSDITPLLARDCIHLSKKGVATLAGNIRYRLQKFGDLSFGSRQPREDQQE